MNPWAEITGRATLWWMKNRPLSKEKRAYRKAKRQAKRKRRRGEALTAEEESVLSKQEDISMLAGKKTYLGIVTALVGLALGWFGIADDALSQQIAVTGSDLVTVVGAAIAAYGRAKAQPKA